MSLLDGFIQDKDGTTPTTVKLGTYTAAVSGQRILYDGTATAFTIKLNPNPEDGDVCAVQEVEGGTNTITVDANGRSVGDPGNSAVPAASYTTAVAYASAYFQFNKAKDTWFLLVKVP